MASFKTDVTRVPGRTQHIKSNKNYGLATLHTFKKRLNKQQFGSEKSIVIFEISRTHFEIHDRVQVQRGLKVCKCSRRR